jgi:TRAP-type C4-dicarboxylate transport system substrate-binding protein
MNAVRSGSIAIGHPGGIASTIFPELGAFSVPYVVRSYDHAYKIFYSKVGDQLDKAWQDKLKLKVVMWSDIGFRNTLNSKRPINTPADFRGLKLRVQPAKLYSDTVLAFGGNPVPMPWAEAVLACQQGVVDGMDLNPPTYIAVKGWEFSKYYSLTAQNYVPSVLVMNLSIWESLTPDQKNIVLDVGREAQARVTKASTDVESIDKLKEVLTPKGVTVNAVDLEPFKKIVEEKMWPAYRGQFGALWDEIVNVKA